MTRLGRWLLRRRLERLERYEAYQTAYGTEVEKTAKATSSISQWDKEKMALTRAEAAATRRQIEQIKERLK